MTLCSLPVKASCKSNCCNRKFEFDSFSDRLQTARGIDDDLGSLLPFFNGEAGIGINPRCM